VFGTAVYPGGVYKALRPADAAGRTPFAAKERIKLQGELAIALSPFPTGAPFAPRLLARLQDKCRANGPNDPRPPCAGVFCGRAEKTVQRRLRPGFPFRWVPS